MKHHGKKIVRQHKLGFVWNSKSNTNLEFSNYRSNTNLEYFKLKIYIRTFVHSYIRTFVPSCIRIFVHSYVCTSVHSYIRTCIPEPHPAFVKEGQKYYIVRITNSRQLQACCAATPVTAKIYSFKT